MKGLEFVACCVLIISGTVKYGNSEQLSAQLDFNATRSLLANVNIYYGLTINENGEFKPTFNEVYQFRERVVPNALTPVYIKKDELYTFTKDVHSMQCSGVLSGSLSLTTPWADAAANFEYAKKSSSSRTHTTAYTTLRYLCQKRSFSAERSQMVITDIFYNEIKAALSHRKDIDKYYELVLALNEFGWYVPLTYTLGGAVYSTTTNEVSKFEDGSTETQKYGVKFGLKIKMVEAGGQIDFSKENVTSREYEQEVRSMMLLQIGGSGVGPENWADWIKSLDDTVHWAVIEYASLMPSLLLLQNKDSALLDECAQLLRRFYDFELVKDMQRYINIDDYQRNIRYR